MIDAEKALLGALLSGYQDLAEVAALVKPDDFYQPLHKAIWLAIHRTAEQGIRPDALTVTENLTLDSLRLPSPLYLFDLSAATPVVANAAWYARQVTKSAKLRAVRECAERMLQKVDIPDADPDELLSDAQQELANQATSAGSDITPISEAVAGVVDIAQHGQRRGLSSPWPDLDRLTRGFYPGRLYVVGARPGVGKSLFGSNAAVHVARQGIGVFVASMEMSETEFTQRCASAEGRIDLGRLESGTLNSDEWARLDEAVGRIQTLPIDIADSESQTLAYIRACARRSAKQHKLGLVIIDYLQMMVAADKKVPRQEQVAEMSRGMKRLARELDAPVIALAQVNRASTQRREGRPTLADLRESGAIEADADSVILLHSDDDRPEEVTAIVAKGRSTAKGEATLLIQGHLSRLVSMTKGVPA